AGAAARAGRSGARTRRRRAGGGVGGDGTPGGAAARLGGGESVGVVTPAPVPAVPGPEALPLTVLHEDRDLLVVDKPAGLVVHPAAGHARGTVVNARLHHGRDLSGVRGDLRRGIVHRAGEATSCFLLAT